MLYVTSGLCRQPRFAAGSVLLLLLSANANSLAGINDGLAGYWSFDDGSGVVAHDDSGNNRDGNIDGASWASGVSGSALSFDGQDDYITIQDSSAMYFANMTTCAWVRKYDNAEVERMIIAKHSSGTPSGYFLEAWENHFAFYSGMSSNKKRIISPQSYGYSWHHVVGVYASGTMRLYVDGVLKASESGAQQASNTNPITIGRLSGGEHAWYGLIDEVRVYNRVLTLSEIQSLAGGGPAEDPPGDDVFYGDQEEWQGLSDDPVNTATGNFFLKETDLSIASRDAPLIFSRYYNSADSYNGPLGPGWTHSYNIILTDLGSQQVSVRWGDGRTDYWQEGGEGGYEALVAGLYDTLVKNGDNTWTVNRKNLDVYHFDAGGRLVSVVDRNSNVTGLAYSDGTHPGRVTDITDPAGRTLSLAYDASGQLDSLTDFASPPRVVHYIYTSGRLTQVTDLLGNPISYSYDANGYLESVTDQRGVQTVFNVYDTEGRATEQRDGNNNLTLFAYDAPEEGRTTITDALGQTTVHTHLTGYRLLCSITNELGDSVAFVYDKAGNRTLVADRNGNATQFVYDARGNVVSTIETDHPVDPNDGDITTVEYSDPRFPDFPTRKIDGLGNETTWEYDASGNAVRQVDAAGNERLWTYNSFGQKLTEQDERGAGYVTQYVYDADGKLTEIINAENDHTWFGYDVLWRLTSVTDGRGASAGDPAHTVTTTYDNANRVTAVAGPITGESYQYDEIGNRTHVTNGRGYATVYTYDNNSNLTQVERPAPGAGTQITQHAYDELNRRVSTTDPNSHTTAHEYDDAGRLVKVTDAESHETTYTHDAHGNVLTETDGAGVTVTHEYDALNRKVRQHDELGNEWHWEYDKLGRMTRHTDANGKETSYVYDELGRLVGVTDPDSNATEYQYDAVGNLTQVTGADGKIIAKKQYDKANRLIRQEDGLTHAYEYGYDGAGNQTSVLDANGQSTTLVYDNEHRLSEIHYPDMTQVTFGYDGNDNRTSMTDANGTTTWVYDELDRLTSSTDSFGKQVQYGYDLAGNRTSVAYPADSTNPARTVVYAYDQANRLDSLTDWAARVTDYTFDGAGRLTEVVYPNGVKETRSHDDAGRLGGLAYEQSDTTPLITYSYTRDPQGNPTGATETGTLPPDLAALAGDVHYAYDADNRLTATDAPAAYAYDNNGNLTSQTKGGGTTAFTYDYEDRLISQTTAGSVVQHTYEGLGNRIARNDNGTASRYVLDRGRSMSHVLCETDASGETIAYYIHGPLLAARIGADGSQRYYHTDPIGNVIGLTDETEAMTDRYAYTPFGIPAGREGTTANPFTYVGGLGVMAEADGLCFMRARFYDPDAGRFLGKDPVEGALWKPIELGKYIYAADSPVRYVDPGGESFLKSLWENIKLVFIPDPKSEAQKNMAMFPTAASCRADPGACPEVMNAFNKEYKTLEEGKSVPGSVFENMQPGDALSGSLSDQVGNESRKQTVHRGPSSQAEPNLKSVRTPVGSQRSSNVPALREIDVRDRSASVKEVSR
ncbi:MAG: hypothetical protein JXA69_08195 [Phycisphaerae bacterium]|nr:hypothetical protein [Phycisphaerae bacterium]